MPDNLNAVCDGHTQGPLYLRADGIQFLNFLLTWADGRDGDGPVRLRKNRKNLQFFGKEIESLSPVSSLFEKDFVPPLSLVIDLL